DREREAPSLLRDERREERPADDHLRYAGALPRDGHVVAAVRFLLQDLDVVLLSGGQGDGGRALRGELGPLAGVGPAADEGDARGVGRVVAGAQAELA